MVRIVIKNVAAFEGERAEVYPATRAVEGERIADVADPGPASSPVTLKALWGICWSLR